MNYLVIPELDWITALQNRVHKIFKRLAYNHEVHVIYFEHKKKGIRRSYRLENNIILHKPPTVYLKNILFFYMINAFTIYSYINKLIRAYNIQMIITTNFLFAPFAIRAARKNKIPFVFDLIDFQSKHIYYINLPLILKKIGSSLLTSLLNFDIRHADYVITTGLPLFRYVKQKGLDNVTIISNGVDNNLFNSSYDGTTIKEKFKIASPIICFIGALEYWIDYHLLFNSFSLLQKKIPNFYCFIIGPSQYYGIDKIKHLASKYNVLDRIIFTGKIPYRRLPPYICASDLCILPFTKNYLTHCIIPMKLFEYLACKRPVISVSLAGVKTIAKNAIFYAETPLNLSKKIHYILTNKQKLHEKIREGNALVQNYDWNKLVRIYERTLEQIYSNFYK